MSIPIAGGSPPFHTFTEKAHPDNRGLSAHDDIWRIDPVRFRIMRHGTVIVVEPWITEMGGPRLSMWTHPQGTIDRQNEVEFEIVDFTMAKLVAGFATGQVTGSYASEAMNVVFRQRIMCSDSGLRWLFQAMPESFVCACIESVWSTWQRDAETLIEDDAFILSGIIAAVAADAMDVAIDMLKTELSEDV